MTFGDNAFDRAFGQLAGPVHWPSLTELEAVHAMAELKDWVEAPVRRFVIEARTPRCCAQHNAMVEALAALRDHERASYADTASPTAAVDWLRALREIQILLTDVSALTQCTRTEHRPPRTA